MARPERFELPTTKFVAWYSIQLSYGRILFGVHAILGEGIGLLLTSSPNILVRALAGKLIHWIIFSIRLAQLSYGRILFGVHAILGEGIGLLLTSSPNILVRALAGKLIHWINFSIRLAQLSYGRIV